MLIWLAVAVLAVIGEMLTTGLFLASVAAAALVTALIALFLPFVAVQVTVFAILALLGILLVRPVVVRGLGIDSLSSLAGPVTHPHLVGRRAIVTRPVDASGGQIRIGEGEFWTARPYNPSEVIPVGAPVEILLVDGLTALVEPIAPQIEAEPAESLPAADIATEKGTE